jgi:hypothetical protein
MKTSALIISATLAVGCCACVPDKEFVPGMTRDDVLRTARPPTFAVTEGAQLHSNLFHAPCKGDPSIESISVYKRRFRSDLVVSFDAQQRVKCAWYVDVVEVVQ